MRQVFPAGARVRSAHLKSSPRASQVIESIEPRRFLAAQFGTVDANFGSGGFASIDVPGSPSATSVNQVITAPDGDFYEGGLDGVARFKPNGKFDTSYGTGGLVSLAGGTFVAEELDPEGYLYVLVQQGDGTALLRYKGDGNLDKSYGQNGSSVITTDPFFTPVALAVQSNGDPIIAGTEQTDRGKGSAVELMRVDTAGALDATFAGTGSVEFHFGSSAATTPTIFDNVAGVDVLASGEILVGGGSVSYDPSSGVSSPVLGKATFATALFKRDGELDGSYGSDGVARSKFASAQVSESLYRDLLIDDNDSNTTPVIQNLLREMLLAVFAARPDGVSFVGATAGAFTGGPFAASFSRTGAVSWEHQLPPNGLDEGQPLSGAAYLADGRVMLLSLNVVTPLYPNGSAGDSIGFDDPSYLPGTVGALTLAKDGDLIASAATPSIPGNPATYQLTAIAPGTISDPQPNVFPRGTVASLANEADGEEDILYYDVADQEVEVTSVVSGTFRTPLNFGHGGPAVSVTEGTNPEDGTPLPIDAYSGPNGRGIYIQDEVYGRGNISNSTTVVTSNNDAIKELTVQETNPAGLGPYYAETAVVYYDQTNRELEFSEPVAVLAGTHWVPIPLAWGDIEDAQFVVAVKSVSTVENEVAFIDNTLGGVYFASQSSNGSWHAKLVAKIPDGADGLSLAKDGSGDIAFQDLATGNLEIAIPNSKGKFTVRTVAHNIGQSTSLPDAADLYAYDARTDTVQYFNASDGFGDPNAEVTQTTVVTGGGADIQFPLTSDGANVAYAASYIDSRTGDLVLAPVAYAG